MDLDKILDEFKLSRSDHLSESYVPLIAKMIYLTLSSAKLVQVCLDHPETCKKGGHGLRANLKAVKVRVLSLESCPFDC